MPRPDLLRVPEYYHKYVDLVEGDDLVAALRDQQDDFVKFMNDIPRSKRDFRYEEGKWTPRDIFQHILDGERIFAYRALRFARKDPTPLASFEEDDYAIQARAEKRKWKDMIREFKALRSANVSMFGSFDDDQLEASGIASGNSIYVRALGFILVGHILHHCKVIKERYLVQAKKHQLETAESD
jgi:hypothetical protein